MATVQEKAKINRINGSKHLPKYASAAALDEKINEYFDTHNTKDNLPKWPGMLNYLDVSDDTLLRYRTEPKYIENGYADVIKKAERRFSDTLIQLAADYPNLQSIAIFLLKQPHNGGYADKQQIEEKKDVNINFQLNRDK